MRKKFLVVTMCVCMAFMTAACSTGTTNNETTNNSSAGDTTAGENASTGAEGESESAAEDIKASDLVQLYDYSQLKTIAKADVEPTEEEVQATIDEQRKLFATTKQVTDRAVEDGDIICMDFTGKLTV